MATLTIDRDINADDVFSMSGGTPCFIALATNSATYQLNPTGYSSWTGTPTITVATNWQSVCYGNNIVVAVSSSTGRIAATSPAGATATWTAREMPVNASWYQVVYGAGVFCATTNALGSATAACATSVDGCKWTSRNMTVSGNWQALCYGNSKFVALSSGTTDIAYSSDGISWSPATTTELSARAWSSVVWGGDKYVAVATGTDQGAYSADGITWHPMTMSSSSNWKSVTYGNGTFVAVSNTLGSIAASSTNGTSWNARTLPGTNANWVGVAFGNNLFTAVSTSSAIGGFSYDGINWQLVTLSSQAVSCLAYTPTTWNSNDTLAITNNATVTVSTDQDKFWNAITLTNGKLLISNTSTSTGIRFTMGRVTGATAAAITPGSGIGDIEISGRWINLGTGSGSSAQTMTAPFSDYIAALWVETLASSGVYEVWLNATGAYGDANPILTEGLSAVGSGARGKFFIQQAVAAPYGPITLTGSDWSPGQKLINVTSTTGIYPGASVSGMGLTLNSVVNRVVSSTQLELNFNTVGEMSPDWTSIAYGNSLYVAVSGPYSDVAGTSSDGITWTKRTLPFVADWTSVCYAATAGGGSPLFVAVASFAAAGMGLCATSPNGVDWTTRALPSTQNWTSVATNGTTFVAVGQTAANAVTTAGAYSADGITWSATVMGSAIWWAVAYGGSRYLAVGVGTLTNYSATGSGTWSTGATLSGSTTVYRALVYNGTIWVVVSGSTSGSQWKADPTSSAFTAGGTLPNTTSRGIAWDGTNFVVVSDTNSAYVARSTAGATWITTTFTGNSVGSWKAIVANGTTLVAVSASSNLRSNSRISTNSGASWSDDYSSVAYGNVSGTTPTYVAVPTYNSNIAVYSTDGGSTWTNATLPYTADWTSVCWGGTTGLFVAVASKDTTGMAYCASSPDGITWSSRTMPSTRNWTSVASNGTTYVAVCQTIANAATTVAASSTNGTTWVAATMATSQIWWAVAYGGGRYVAVGVGAAVNYDTDGAGTWSANATALTSATYRALVYNGSVWMAISGSSTNCQYKADPTSGTFTVGGALPNATSRGIAWDGTNFVVVSTGIAGTVYGSYFTAYSTDGTSWTLSNLTSSQVSNWNAICNNGTTLMAVGTAYPYTKAVMTSTDSGATWTTPAVSTTGMTTDVSLTCFNTYEYQLTTTIQFGDGVHGNLVPTGANVRCPNIMFTSTVPANIQTASRLVGANMVMTSGGSLTADICLFDESYNNFGQTEILSLTNCGFALPPLITECYNTTINSVGFALEPVRRYYAYTAVLGTNGWLTRDTRYGNSATNAWNYINEAVVTDLNIAVGQPQTLLSAASSITSQISALYVTNTVSSVWNNIRVYSLNTNHSYQSALSLTSLFNDNTITNLECYGLGAFILGTSNDNTITNITYSEDMFNGYKSMASAFRIGNDPIAGAKLLGNGTRYYIKVRTFYDWTNRTSFYEGRVVSSTPFLGSKWFPQSLSVYNSGTRAVTLTWVRRDPTSAVVSYTIFRGGTYNFTRDSTSRIFYSPTNTVVTYTNGFVAQFTALGDRRITFNKAGRTIAAEAKTGYSFITDGFVIGANVVVTNSSSNDGTYMISAVAANLITLATNHTNLTDESLSTAATLNGQVPTNSTTTPYFYRLLKCDSTLTMTTNCSGTLVSPTDLTTSSNFTTGLGTIINCEGTAGSNKIRIPVGSTTNFLAGNVTPGLLISSGGVHAGGTTISSVDTPWQITVGDVNDTTFSAATLSLGLPLGAATNMYVYGPGIAWPTKVLTVNNTQSITVDTNFLAAFTNQTVNFMYGTESEVFECMCTGPTTPAFNFLTYSDDFSNANWVKTGITATVNAIRGPNDVPFSSASTSSIPGATCDRLTSTAANATAVQTITNLESGATYTFSVYVMTDKTVQFPTVAGQITINTTSPTTQAFTATGIWQRITATFTATAAAHAFTIQITPKDAYIYAATAMVNPGATALPPIVTTTVKTAVASGTRTLQFYPFVSGVTTSNTIVASSGDFTLAPAFAIGDSIIVAGTTNNDGQYVLSNVAATVLTVTPAQPLVAEGPISAGSITGSVLAAAAQELTLAAAWNKSLSGNTANQGIELTLATLPVGAHYTEIYLGTASNFDPSDFNRIGYAGMPGSPSIVTLSSAANNKVDTVGQLGSGGLTGPLAYLTGSSNNMLFNFTTDFNYAADVASVLTVTSLSNDNIFDDFTIKNWRNNISGWSPFTFVNNTSGVTVQNITFDNYDVPIYASATNSGLGVVLKGVTGGRAEPITSATTWALGSLTDGLGVSFTAVYDTIFSELFDSPTTGTLQLRFNASSATTPPYTVLTGTPTFSNTGRLYMRTAGDSIEYTWPHRIYSVSGFRDIPPKLNTYDLGQATTTNPDSAFSLLVEYAIKTGDTYGAYKTMTAANLISESVNTTTGFFIKFKITTRAGMMFSTQTNPFVVNEVIRGVTSGAKATVSELYQLTTTAGVIVFSGAVTGTFLPAELIVKDDGGATRATNVVTNGQFACFPSYNSFIDGLAVFTNSTGPGDYPGQTVNLVLTNVVENSRYYVYRTSDLVLLGSGTASTSNPNFVITSTGIGTVTIPNVTYIANFGITIRVRKSSATPKYVPLETQATVNSAGATVYIGQVADAIAAT